MPKYRTGQRVKVLLAMDVKPSVLGTVARVSARGVPLRREIGRRSSGMRLVGTGYRSRARGHFDDHHHVRQAAAESRGLSDAGLC